MKIEKSNNPAAVGALVLVLLLIAGRIIWMVVGHSGSVSAASTASAGSLPVTAPSSPATKATPASEARPALEADRVPSTVTPVTTRNPFSVPIQSKFAATRPDDPPHPHVRTNRRTTGAEAVPLMSLPPFPVRILEPGLRAGAKPPAPNGLSVLPPHQITAKGQMESLPMLKLTATVGGAEPTAVVQTTSPEPLLLHVGDSFAGMRVIAIHEQEVVFARGNGFWTLRLQSAADSVVIGSIPATTKPATSQPVVSVAAPEEKNHGPE